MSLSAGARLGPYEILAPIGAGGMGEVYRARDARLDRTVAIKILRTSLSDSEHLRQRFEREAHAVSSLSHPHICALYDVGHHDGMDYLVMEFLEGETLAARIRKGPLPTNELLRYAIELADALDLAHRQGLVHRDLKPGNIMLTRSGTKLLDFGLAKLIPSPDVAQSATAPPTATSPLTTRGTIVGTYQYMAPEQLEGADVDVRTDIFAFGCVLYEMATGHQAFEGKTQAGVIAAILEREPVSVSTHQPRTPPALERLIRTCMAKDPADRRQTMHDLLLDLKWISEGGSEIGLPAIVSARRRLAGRLGWVAAGIFLAAALGLAGIRYRDAGREIRVVRASIPAPAKTEYFLVDVFPGPAAVSPDGRRVVFTAKEQTRPVQLWVRDLDSDAAHPLAGTDGAAYPFWSPDNHTVGFFAEGKLKRTEISGGPVFTLCKAENGKGGTWNRDGTILFAATHNSGIYRVAAAGGEAKPVTAIDTTQTRVSHRFPHFLPDGRHFLYFARGAISQGADNLMVASLDDGAGRPLMPAESNAIYASGHLLFMKQETLMARPFDPRRLRFAGEAFPIAENVLHIGAAALGIFSASQNGVLVYHTGGLSLAELTWMDPTGKPIGTIGDPAGYAWTRISPDGEQIAVEIEDPSTGKNDIWIVDVERGVRTRVTFEPAAEESPIWSPDGSTIVYASARQGQLDLYRRLLTGSGRDELLLQSANDKFPSDWHPEGHLILYETEGDVWVLPLSGDRQPYPLMQSRFQETNAVFSPDGEWIVYRSDESGQSEVYMTSFPGPGRKWQVSSGGSMHVGWPRKDDRIWFVSAEGNLTTVEVRLDRASPRIGAPKELFSVLQTNGGTVAADGQRILLSWQSQFSADHLNLVVNWREGLSGD